MSTALRNGRGARRSTSGIMGAGLAVGLALVMIAPGASATGGESSEPAEVAPVKTSVDAAATTEAAPEQDASSEDAPSEEAPSGAPADEPEAEATDDLAPVDEPVAESLTVEDSAAGSTETDPAPVQATADAEASTSSSSEPSTEETKSAAPAASCTGEAVTWVSIKPNGDAAARVIKSGCSTGETLNVSSFTLDQSALNDSTVFGLRNPTSVPQTLFRHGVDIEFPDSTTQLTVGQLFTGSVDVPDCGDYQVDVYSGAEQDTVGLDNRLPGLRAGYIVLQDECEVEQAEFCPGIDDDTDYRELFSYEYFAGTGSAGFVSLGSTVDWSDQVKVEQFSDENPDAVDNMMIRAIVTLKDDVDITTGACEYDFSLASYETEGPTWPTSGTQTFLGHDTDTIDVDSTEITLDVPLAECYGQSDLYTGTTVYNGDSTPNYPNNPISAAGELIASWNGGAACDTEPAEPEEPTETPTVTPTETPTEPTETPTEPAETPTEPAETPTEPAVVPTVTPTVPTQVLGTQFTAAPTVQAAVLARTGVEAWTIALIAGLLVVGGGSLLAVSGLRGGRQSA